MPSTAAILAYPEQPELKPCPFCGGEAAMVRRKEDGTDSARVICRGCACQTVAFYASPLGIHQCENAKTYWNRRVTDDA